MVNLLSGVQSSEFEFRRAYSRGFEASTSGRLRKPVIFWPYTTLDCEGPAAPQPPNNSEES